MGFWFLSVCLGLFVYELFGVFVEAVSILWDCEALLSSLVSVLSWMYLERM